MLVFFGDLNFRIQDNFRDVIENIAKKQYRYI